LYGEYGLRSHPGFDLDDVRAGELTLRDLLWNRSLFALHNLLEDGTMLGFDLPLVPVGDWFGHVHRVLEAHNALQEGGFSAVVLREAGNRMVLNANLELEASEHFLVLYFLIIDHQAELDLVSASDLRSSQAH